MTTPVRPPTPTLAAIVSELVALDTYTSALESALAAAQTPPTPVQPPTPIQPPIVPPVVITPPTPPVTGLATLWRDDFTRYGSTTDLLANFCKAPGVPHMEQSSPPTGNIQLETIDGVPCMALGWPGGGLGPTPTISPRFNPPPAFTALDVTWVDLFSPDFVVTAEYKDFLVKLGAPVGSAGMPQIGVYREPGGLVKMDITDRTHNINTGSPIPGIPGNSPIQTHPVPIGDGVKHTWTIKARDLGSQTASFTLLLDGAPIIGPLVGPFLPGAVIGGSIGQLLIIEPGSNYNSPLPPSPQTRWIQSITVSTGV